jgi:hypothetical protein
VTTRPRGRPQHTRACTRRRTHATDVRADEPRAHALSRQRKEDQAPTRKRRQSIGVTPEQKASQRRITVTATPRQSPDLDLIAQALASITEDLQHLAEQAAEKGPRP